MVNLRLNSSSGDRQYKTPKAYDYVQAVKEKGAQGNLTRGKEIRENITRGNPTRKIGFGERDATRKGTAETRRFGRENNAARELNDPDPNFDPNLDRNLDPNLGPKLDPNLDPNLQHVGAQDYQQVPIGNLYYGAAPNANDEPGWPPGAGWQDPEDIEDSNRRLNNPNHDGDGIIEDSPVAENENEHDNGKDRINDNDSRCLELEEGEKPFERPMMTKKVISSQSRGKTENYDETLRWQDSDGAWVPAVYHESIRLDLIHKASLKGKYVHERGAGITPGDITSYLESQRMWGTERGGQYGPNYHEGNWPAILYQLKKPGDFSKSNYAEADYWKYNGRIVLSVHDSLPLRKYKNLPDTISSKISGAELEAMLRSDPRVETRDIKGRMPMYYVSETGERTLSFSPSTFSMRTHRFRAQHALLCWRERAGPGITNALVLNYLKENEPRAFQEGNVEGIGPIPKTVQDAILGSNKSNPAVINRAGQKYALGDKQNQPQPKAAPAPKRGLRDNRSRSPPTTGQTITDRKREPLEQNPTTTQKRLPQSAQPPGQPPAASRPPRGRPRTKGLPPAGAPQPPEQQPPLASGPPREGPKMEKKRGRAPSQSPEQQPPQKRPKMKKAQERAPSQSPEQQSPPRSPEQPIAPPRPLTRGHENDAPTTVLQPQRQEVHEQLPAASIPPGPPRTKARTKYVPPPRPKTRRDLRSNQSTSLTQQSDERRGGREREPPAQNPVRTQTRSQTRSQAARAVSQPAEQKLPPTSRLRRRVEGINPPMTIPQPKQQAGNRPPPKSRSKKK